MEDKPICGHCRLFNPKTKRCGVLVMFEGQKVNLPVDSNDECFFEQEFKAIDVDNRKVEKFKVDVQQVKIWVENPKTGEKCKKGVVKIEYPEGFFGDEKIPELEE